MAIPFVGRAAELRVIADAAHRVQHDRKSTAVMLVGLPGAGKTRLLSEARDHHPIRRQYSVVGYEPERQVPLAAASEFLRAIVRAEPGGPLAAALADVSNAGQEPIRIFEAAHQAFERAGPVLIVVDDLQWVDDLSVALCHYLIRSSVGGRSPIGLIVASRPTEASEVMAASLAKGLADPGAVIVSELGPLGRDDGMRLVRSVLPESDRDGAEAIWAMAAGSPFWLEAIARSRAGDNDLDRSIEVRLQRLGFDPAAMIAALAVVGRPVHLRHISELEGWSSKRAQAAADQLVGRGLATRLGQDLEVSHDLIRAAAYRATPANDRRRLHRRWAEMLEAEAGDDVAALRAALEHRRAAAMPTIDLALRLASSLKRRWLGAAGLASLILIADEVERTDPRWLVLGGAVAGLASEVGDHRLALVRWSRLADACPPGPARVTALLSAARSAFELRDLAAARSLTDRGRAERPMSADAIQFDALEAQIVMWLEHRVADGWLLARRAVLAARRLARSAGGIALLDTEERRAVVAALLVGIESAVQADDALRCLRLAREYADVTRGFDEAAHLQALRFEGIALRLSGRPAEAVPLFQAAWDEARRRSLPMVAVEVGFALANALTEAAEPVA